VCCANTTGVSKGTVKQNLYFKHIFLNCLYFLLLWQSSSLSQKISAGRVQVKCANSSVVFKGTVKQDYNGKLFSILK